MTKKSSGDLKYIFLAHLSLTKLMPDDLMLSKTSLHLLGFSLFFFFFQQESVERQNRLEQEVQSMAESLAAAQKKMTDERGLI